MDFLEKNLNSLKAHNLFLYRKIAAHFKDKNLAIASRLFQDEKLGFWNLEYTDAAGKMQILYKDTPAQEYEKSRILSSLNEPQILILDGFGLGEHFVALMSHRQKSWRFIFVLEKSLDVFVNALKLTDFSAYFSANDIEFCVGLEDKEFPNFLLHYFINKERLIYSKRIGHFFFHPSLTLDGPYYVKFANHLSEVLDFLSSTYTASSEDNFIGLRNILDNFEFIKKTQTIFSLKNSFAGKPALLVGAGPSLSGQLEFVKKNRDRFLIACCDAALKPLVSHGIEPHVIVCSERMALQKLLFECLPKNAKSALFTLPSIDPLLYREFSGPVVLLGRMATFANWLWPDNDLNVGISVSSVAFCALSYLGCKSIYLLGQNLAYGRKDNAAYVSGMTDYVETSNSFKFADRVINIEGNDGNPIATKTGYDIYRREIERNILHFGIPTYNVINADEGAKIGHATRLDVKDFWESSVPQLPSANYDDFLAALLQKNPVPENQARELDNLIGKSRTYLEAVQSACYQAIEDIITDLYSNLMNNYKIEDYQAAADSHLQMWRELQEKIINIDRDKFYLFINCVFSKDHITIMQEREAAVPTLDQIVPYTANYCFNTIDWMQKLSSWAGRLKHLIDHHVKR